MACWEATAVSQGLNRSSFRSEQVCCPRTYGSTANAGPGLLRLYPPTCVGVRVMTKLRLMLRQSPLPNLASPMRNSLCSSSVQGIPLRRSSELFLAFCCSREQQHVETLLHRKASALYHCCSCSPQQSVGIRPRQGGHYRGPTRCCSCPQKLTMSPTSRNCVPAAALHKRGP